jgi:hypothetical protein
VMRFRDGKVHEVYAKHKGALDSWSVYVLSADMDWESPDFKATFPQVVGESPNQPYATSLASGGWSRRDDRPD